MTCSNPILRSDDGNFKLPSHPRSSLRLRPFRQFNWAFVKEQLLRTFRILFPSLLAITLTTTAHAQGTMDFSGAQTLMTTFKPCSPSIKIRFNFSHPIEVVSKELKHSPDG